MEQSLIKFTQVLFITFDHDIQMLEFQYQWGALLPDELGTQTNESAHKSTPVNHRSVWAPVFTT